MHLTVFCEIENIYTHWLTFQLPFCRLLQTLCVLHAGFYQAAMYHSLLGFQILMWFNTAIQENCHEPLHHWVEIPATRKQFNMIQQ